MKKTMTVGFVFVAFFSWVSLSSATSASIATSPTAPPQDRPLSVDDLFRIEQVEVWEQPVTSESPDGEWFAFSRKRPRAGETRYANYLYGLQRNDIWISSTEGGEANNITHGLADSAGYWNPVWSPDSQRLALYSTRGGLWVWERARNALKQITDRDLVSPSRNFEGVKVVWLSERLIICAVLPGGQTPVGLVTPFQVAEQATRAWERTAAGQEPSVSVLTNDESSPLSGQPQGELLLIDVVSGETRSLATGHFSHLTPAPDGNHLAMLEWGDIAPTNPDRAPTSADARTRKRLAVFTRDGLRLRSGSPEISFFGSSTPKIGWAPDGRNVAIMGRPDGVSNAAPYVAHIERDAFRMRSTGELIGPEAALDASRTYGFAWSNNSGLVLRGAAKTGPSARLDWWRVSERGVVSNLTHMLRVPPTILLTAQNGDLIGLADGKLWRLSRGATSPIEIRTGLLSNLTSLDWADPSRTDPLESLGHVQGTFSEVLVTSNDGTKHVVDLNSGRTRILPLPHPDAKLLSYSPRTQSAYFAANARQGSYLWQVRAGQQPRTMVETNTFLRHIAEGEARKIEYVAMDGRPLTAWILLPNNYRPGRRYPTVVWVYPVRQNGEHPDSLTNMNSDSFLNLQLMSAQGYAVLIPSVTDDSHSLPGLSNGVLPAVTEAVKIGYSDPERMGVWGVSHGGFTTYALITLPNPFRAAVAQNGFTDYTSNAGTFLSSYRYFDFAHDRLPGHNNLAPWRPDSLQQSYRLSPIQYTDQVQTPLLILHSDMEEFFPIEQAEEYFTALRQQNKPVQFARYWGEGHQYESPANIRDMWTRIVAWFDQYLDVSRDEAGDMLWDGDRVRAPTDGALVD